MKIGLLGGSFNPIHNAHLILAREAKKQLGLERILFIPSCSTPKKEESLSASPEDRLEMVKIAIRNDPGFSFSDIEIRRGGVSYTIDTVKALRKEMPEASFVFLIGSDALAALSTWKSADELLRLCPFAVAERPGFPVKKISNGTRLIRLSPLDISSEMIRQRVSEGKPVTKWVPPAVWAYIREHALYR